MKLLIINDLGINGGGAEQRIKLMAEYFLETGFCEEIHLIEASTSNSAHDRIIIHKCSGSGIESFFLAWKTIRENKIDLVQVHNLLLVKPECVLAARLLGKKVVWFFHDWWLLCANRTLFNGQVSCLSENLTPCKKCAGLAGKAAMALNKFCVNQCDLGNASTNFAKNILERNGILKGKFFVTLPWIDKEFFLVKRKKPHNNIVFVGSLERYKGAFVAAKAMKKILQKIPNAKLLLIGSGQEGEKRRIIEEIGRQDGSITSFVFLGKHSHEKLARIYETAGCAVCPSVWPEPTGTTWMEAGAAGMPVVASRIGGIPEIFPSKNLLFEPGNHLDLAEKILKAVKTKQDREIFSEKFSRKNLEEIMEKYRGLLSL